MVSVSDVQPRPLVAGVLWRSLGTAAALADGLCERRAPAVTRRLSGRERRTEIVAAVGFVLAAAVLPFVAPTRDADGMTVGLLVIGYALMRRVRFQLGPGLIRPTQLVFVPLLMLTPAPWVPLLVGVGSLLGELPDVARRTAHPERLLVSVADGWYSFGPALVVGLFAAGEGPRVAAAVLVAALMAQFITDLAVSSLREWFGAGIRPGELLPVLALVYLVDTLLSPLGYLAVLASQTYEHAYLLAIAPGAVLGLLAGERRGRITRERDLGRAFRRSAGAVEARTQELRRQVGWLQRPDRPMGEALPAPVDRATLEPLLLATIIDAVHADGGRLSARFAEASTPPVVIGETNDLRAVLDTAERALGTANGRALALSLSSGHVLAIARQGAAFSPVERELVEELAAHMALALENRRLGELTRQTDDELRGILEGVADAVVVEDPSGRIMYRNPAADALLGELPDLATALDVAADALPSRRIFADELPRPLVVRHADGRRWSRVNSTAVPERGRARLAITTIEDITDIKRAEEAQRFLAESSRVLASSLDLNETLSRVERLAAGWIGGQWTVDVRPVSATPPAPGTDALRVPIRVRAGVAGEITLSGVPVGPLETAVAEDLALRVGSAVDLARVYLTRPMVAQTLQASLLPPVPPQIAGLETAGLYRPAAAQHELGGDFYDVFSTGPHTWHLVSGDVRARGAEAAAMSALTRQTIREAAMQHRSPAKVLAWVNDAILGRREPAFLGVAYARLDLVCGVVAATVACGGHPAPRILRASGAVEAFGNEGGLLGVRGGVALHDRTTALRQGDALILYTDGLLKAAAPAEMTPEELHTILVAAVGQTAEGIVEHMAAMVEGPVRDDLAILAVRLEPTE